jgi:hypothetical protein
VIAIPCLGSTGFWKPTLHLRRGVRGDQAHPSWRWVWDGMRFCVPLIEMGGAPRELLTGTLPTVTGAPGWARELPGEAATFNGSSWYQWGAITIPPARPITVLTVFRVAPTGGVTYQGVTSSARVAGQNDAWTVYGVVNGSRACELWNSNESLAECALGAVVGDAWYAAAFTTDRTGGTPRGAMVRLDTRQLTTAVGTQRTLPTQSAGPTLALGGYGAGDEPLIGAVALAAWLPGVAWTDQQLITWVHDPFAFLIPARVWWMPSTPVAPAGSAARISWTELEIPTALTRGRVSWSELEVPFAPTRGQVSWVELETPTALARGRVSWAELEAPFASTRGQISWAELEAPFALTRGRVSWAEFEAPSIGATSGRVSWAEFEAPFALTRGRVSWAEFEVPFAPTRGRVSWSELEIPTALTRARVSWAEMEAPGAPTRARVSWVELEVPTSAGEVRRMRVRWWLGPWVGAPHEGQGGYLP